MNVLQYIQINWKEIGEGLEVVGANVYAFYAFVSNHGGLIPMWNKFLGKTNNETAKPNEKINP